MYSIHIQSQYRYLLDLGMRLPWSWWYLTHQVLSVKIRCRDKLTLTLYVTQDTERSFFLFFFKRHTDWLKLLDRTFYTCIFVQNYIFKYPPPPPSQCNLHSISENLEFLHRAFSQKSEIIHTCAAHVEEQTSAMTRRNITRTRNRSSYQVSYQKKIFP